MKNARFPLGKRAWQNPDTTASSVPPKGQRRKSARTRSWRSRLSSEAKTPLISWFPDLQPRQVLPESLRAFSYLSVQWHIRRGRVSKPCSRLTQLITVTGSSGILTRFPIILPQSGNTFTFPAGTEELLVLIIIISAPFRFSSGFCFFSHIHKTSRVALPPKWATCPNGTRLLCCSETFPETLLEPPPLRLKLSVQKTGVKAAQT